MNVNDLEIDEEIQDKQEFVEELIYENIKLMDENIKLDLENKRLREKMAQLERLNRMYDDSIVNKDLRNCVIYKDRSLRGYKN
jgi:regulator of replication initiation timing